MAGRLLLRAGLAAALLAMPLAASAGPRPVIPAVGPHGLKSFPDARATCGTPPEVRFVVCVDQRAVMKAARAQAAADGRQLLVSVGADWCVWCKIMDRYFNGWSDPALEPRAAGGPADAQALARFMADTFVVVELNVEGDDYEGTLRDAGLDPDDITAYPAVFIVRNGKMRPVAIDKAQISGAGDVRGYSRKALARILRQAAEGGAPERDLKAPRAVRSR